MNKLIALALLPLAACVPEFDPGSLIKDTRVLGAKVEVEGDAERSTPHPGETANVVFVIEGVEKDPVVSWSLAVCLPAPLTNAPCPESVLARSEGTGTTPTLQVVVPAESALGDASSLHVSGVIDGTPLVYELALARSLDEDNLQPSLQQTRFKLDGKDWFEGEALVRGCRAQPELPQVNADEKEHKISITLGPDARELYVGADMEAIYEELQLSTFVSAGELERQFSFVESNDDRERPTVDIKWTAPKRLRDTADLGVRLLVVVRDSRGGLSVLERALCTVRPSSGQLSAVAAPARPDARRT
ncbi:MAG TPA: hypothetical protein VFX59_02005 [Polyangiales bacterium]|nr:hypothetical protein [Polyangiales bacterium]